MCLNMPLNPQKPTPKTTARALARALQTSAMQYDEEPFDDDEELHDCISWRCPMCGILWSEAPGRITQ